MLYALEFRALRGGSCAPCTGGREGRVACATRPWKVFDVCRRLEVALHALEMLEGMRRVLLCMLEAVEGEICLLAVPEVMRCVLLCLLEALKALEVLEMLEVPEVMRCVLLCLLQALEVLETL